MKAFLQGLEDILSKGKPKPNPRTGKRTISYNGLQMRFSLLNGFPMITTRTIPWKAVVGEFLWMMSGSTNVKDLQALNVNFWNPWFTNGDEGGRIYGYQFRNWGGEVDQISEVIEGMKSDPFGRRHLINLWNPIDLKHPSEKPILPPCHYSTQFMIETCSHTPNDERPKYISTHLVMRSWDVPVGGPFNIAFYGLLTYLMGKQLNLRPKELIVTASDAHIYEEQVPTVRRQLLREPLTRPNLVIEGNPCLKTMNFGMDNFYVNDRNLGKSNDDLEIKIKLCNYLAMGKLDYPVAV